MISAIVLAAGESTRFGEPKQLVRVAGKALLEHTLDHLRASRVGEIVVVVGAHADEIKKQVKFDRERIVFNPDFASGMSTSLHAGLREIKGDAALIVLADQPFVRPETIDLLISEYEHPRNTTPSIVAPPIVAPPIVAPPPSAASLAPESRGPKNPSTAVAGEGAGPTNPSLAVAGEGAGPTNPSLAVAGEGVGATRPQVVIPTYNGRRGNPVLVDRSLFAEMMSIRGDIGCRAIFGDHAESIVKVPVDDRGVVTDIDTPSDLAGSEADLFERIVDLRRRRQPFAIATVVRAERPTSSKPGDKAIIAPDGTLTGWIGGSCAHDIVVRNALEALEAGAPRFLTLSASAAAEAKRFGVIEVPMQCYSGGVLDVFIEPSLPRPHMVIIGNETIPQALARISQILRFQVTVVEDSDLGALNLSGETYIVVATHGRYDEEALEQAVKTDASYIALVASPKRAGVILDALRERGVDVSRIKSPAGLDLGAEGAEEIALSIVAEIVQQRRAATKRGAEVSRPETAIDPICNMTVDVADARYTAEFQGQRYYFCCAHCLRTFEQSHVA